MKSWYIGLENYWLNNACWLLSRLNMPIRSEIENHCILTKFVPRRPSIVFQSRTAHSPMPFCSACKKNYHSLDSKQINKPFDCRGEMFQAKPKSKHLDFYVGLKQRTLYPVVIAFLNNKPLVFRGFCFLTPKLDTGDMFLMLS